MAAFAFVFPVKRSRVCPRSMWTDPFINGNRGDLMHLGVSAVMPYEDVMFENQQLTVSTPTS
jgi:hypothetical protein